MEKCIFAVKIFKKNRSLVMEIKILEVIKLKTGTDPLITFVPCYYGTIMHVKVIGARSNCFGFSSNFRRFWYQKKAHFFLITLVKFHG